MHMIRMLALVAVVLALTACSEPPIVDNRPAQPAAAAVGTKHATVSGATLTLHGYRDNLDRGTYKPADGNRWIGVDIETCPPITSKIQTNRWQLTDTANRNYLPGHPYDDMPGAGYREGTLAQAGTCVRGWLPFQVPTNETVNTVQYVAPDGAVFTWKP